MSGRPEVLFPLFSALDSLPGIGPKSAVALEGAGIATPKDLALMLPANGTDRRLVPGLVGRETPVVTTVEVEIGRHHPPRQRGRPYRIDATASDATLQLVYFHAHRAWLEDQFPEGEQRIVSGKLEMFDGVYQMPHPDHVLEVQDLSSLPEFEPIYPLTEGVTQKAMTRAVHAAVERVPDLAEWADPALVAQEGWRGFKDALVQAHAPQSSADLAPSAPSRRRLAYDEVFAHQLTLALARANRRAKPGIETRGTGALRDKIIASLPYTPTGAQTRAIKEIDGDLAAPQRMNRLLQGDVGAGKTLVAVLAMATVVEAGGQAVLMAPTEVLARQHFSSVAPLCATAGVRVEVLTGRDKGAGRRAKLEALARGEIDVLIGTHAVFQDDVELHDLRLAVIDEQHRFGVAQRMKLGAKGTATDVLVMTATPIPRSLALAGYGDMDVSVLDEKPPGRTPVTTALVSDGRMDEVVQHLRDAIGQGRQAYWVCPLVEESEVLHFTAAEERFKRLRAALGDDVVGLVHGRMAPEEKDAAMAAFSGGQTRVLVATTVIEVGVDVPNASIMVVEGAERFGLSQLHQLRGRVGRGAAASTCLLMYKPPLGETAQKRLETLRETEDGFRISEVDLELRGAGDLIGMAQSGLPRFRIADLEHQAGLMATAQTDARALLEKDPDLTSSRGQAARVLLWLMEQDRAIRLISVG
ncbi:MAG: ATP-dependent DNA helicase RecG [Rhodobacteraceae bacterium]|nr:ATP-dependent DNA helicase RecG [Paracoccaceae bacterium]